MFPQLYTAASAMVTGEQTLDLVTGNLANIRTPGFRPDRPVFATYLSALTASNVPGGFPAAPRGVVLVSSWRSDDPGPLRQSGNPLDLALAGPGWFRVSTPNGERLTRAGNFTRANDGRLVTVQGYDVLDDNGHPIQLPEGRIGFGTDGTVTVDDNVVARLGLAQGRAQDMVREGQTLWKPPAKPAPLDMKDTQVQQGFLEESAVDTTSELVTLIQAQRMYEMQNKILDMTANTLARKAIELGEPR